jgi:ATP-binding cassette, sub-family E, member 1
MTRIAVLEKDKCAPAKCGDYLCIRLCPINRSGDECIVKGEDKKASINTELCTGCGICPKRCPFEAIHIVNLPEALDQEPIHRYGENGFHLYSLPTPMFGKVVGIIGKNGIGKSTAMKILAGVLNPNLGKEEDATPKELIDYFKGTEAQIFFEKQRDNEIVISYKPQAVDLIPKHSKGKVRDLLEKVDEKKKLKEIVEKLDLKDVLDNDIEKISGGELQRVAIAAAVLKDANVYFFDEPTSFLDVKQRIKVSKFIKELADENTAVVVIEHDMIILDYMTDLVHIMYGEEGAYGIVAHPQTTRVGINTYLDGYLRDENMRFRDHAIKFDKRPPIEHKTLQKLTSWKDIQTKLGNFSLTAKEGELSRNIVTGILGENGIGKTSFVKILAGLIDPDKGTTDEKIKVSYKPQYIDTESDEVVAVVLADAIKKHEVQLIRPLNIKPLMLKKLDELSGGELQRVAIALCLSKDADLYLLDEPSAYLDVEQRLVISKIIREFMETNSKSALVVDHDLLFMDYLSEKLSVFSGKPAVEGNVEGPFPMEEGMNMFLSDLGVTFRRDDETNRPRANKPESQMDRKQRSEGKLYYS